MTKRKSLIDWWGGETHPKTTTLCYYSCRELLDEGFFCFHHDCFKDDQPAMKCSPVPHVTRILFQDSRSCMSYVDYCWCQAFLIKASITSELIHYGNVGKQNPVYKSLHTTCFWQHFLVRLLLKALEVLRTAEFAGKFVWRIVFIAWFSSAYLPSWSYPKVSHEGWRAGSVLKSINCTSEDPSFISRSSQLLIIWTPEDWTPPSLSGSCSYVHNASLPYLPTSQAYFLKFFSFKVNF